jgi:hypothetical protein
MAVLAWTMASAPSPAAASVRWQADRLVLARIRHVSDTLASFTIALLGDRPLARHSHVRQHVPHDMQAAARRGDRVDLRALVQSSREDAPLGGDGPLEAALERVVGHQHEHVHRILLALPVDAPDALVQDGRHRLR